jgi:hypothetical protein
MRSARGFLVFAAFWLGAAAAHGGQVELLRATGGAGEVGGAGGDVVIEASDAVIAGAGAKVKAPKAPKIPTRAALVAGDTDMNFAVEIADLDASPADLDPDLFEVTVRGDVLVPAGTTLEVESDATLVSTQGGVFVVGDVADDDGSLDGASLSLVSLRKAVVVQGGVDLAGELSAAAGDGGELDLAGAQVAILGSVNVSGGQSTGGGEDGGGGGRVDVRPSSPVIHGKIAAQLGADAAIDLSGGTSGTGGEGGDGGAFDVDYTDVLGNPSALTLAGDVDAQGGIANGGGAGGDGGTIQADVGGPLAVMGLLDARGGDGTDGGSGGAIELGGRAAGKGPISLLVPGATEVGVQAAGGFGGNDSGGTGGLVSIEADLRGIQWTGSFDVRGGTSADGDGADGGDVLLTSWGPRGPVRVTGSILAPGSDAGGDGEGSSGGEVALVSLDGEVALTGSVNTSGGDAAGGGNDGGSAGDLFLLADDTNGLPGTVDAIDLLDDVGGPILVSGGNLTATGGNGGGGDSDGGDGGTLTVDADGDDGEQPGNGEVELGDGVVVNANGGNGTGTGGNGDGGDVTVRGSNGDEDGAASGVIQGIGVAITSVSGSGGVGGTAGAIVVD